MCTEGIQVVEESIPSPVPCVSSYSVWGGNPLRYVTPTAFKRKREQEDDEDDGAKSGEKDSDEHSSSDDEDEDDGGGGFDSSPDLRSEETIYVLQMSLIEAHDRTNCMLP